MPKLVRSDSRDKPKSREDLPEALYHLVRQITCLVEALKNDNNQAVLLRLDTLDNQMSKLTDQLKEMKDSQAEQSKDIASLAVSAEANATSTANISTDIDNLNKKIEELQNSEGGVTPEDQVLIDGLQAEGAATAAKVKAAAEAAAAHAAALQALDEKTPAPEPS